MMLDSVRDRLWTILRLHARQPAFQRRVRVAAEHVAAAARIGPCVVGISGGKDSSALLHLARGVDPTITGCWIDSGCETEWTLDTLAALRLTHPIETVHPALSLPEMARQVGLYGHAGATRLAGDWHWTTAAFRHIQIDDPSAEMRRVTEARTGRTPAVVLLGLRAEESRGRRLSRYRRGVLYEKAGAGWMGTPIADWSGRDVLTYLLLHQVPISAEYLQAGDALDERTRRRTDATLWVHGTSTGKWARLRQEHPALWQRLTADFPDLRLWG